MKKYRSNIREILTAGRHLEQIPRVLIYACDVDGSWLGKRKSNNISYNAISLKDQRKAQLKHTNASQFDLLIEVLYSNVPKLDCRCIFGSKVHIFVLSEAYRH